MVEERVLVLVTLILSKIWYRAQIIPMPDRWVKLFEREIYRFLWRGWIRTHPVKRDVVSLPKLRGGLGFTSLKLKTNALLLKQCFRMLLAGGNSRQHLNFWMGGRMRCDLVPDVYHHIRELRRGVADTTAPLFVEYLTLYEMGRMGEWFDLTNPESFTAKGFYGAQVELLPDPEVQQVDPGTDWPSVWKRRQSGVLSKTSREVLYFLLQDKTMTRVFIKRIYPNTDDTR
ncbi:MAG: hypothetical protein GY782_03445 [Gammaproteobacteria bacterium]|nr:hypothetical protein [Gammaproteobacteria bacterium]